MKNKVAFGKYAFPFWGEISQREAVELYAYLTFLPICNSQFYILSAGLADTFTVLARINSYNFAFLFLYLGIEGQ